MPPKLALAPAHGSTSGYTDSERLAALNWLANVESAFLACRGRHNFPKLLLTEGQLPPGIRAERQADRSYNITETCPDCGTRRTYSTVPDGWLGGLKIHYRYEWPDGYRVPPGAMTWITLDDMKAEQWTRVREALEAADKLARKAKRQAGAAAGPRAVPAVRFNGGA